MVQRTPAAQRLRRRRHAVLGPGGRASWSAKPSNINSLISLYNPYLGAYGAEPWPSCPITPQRPPLAQRHARRDGAAEIAPEIPLKRTLILLAVLLLPLRGLAQSAPNPTLPTQKLTIVGHD